MRNNFWKDHSMSNLICTGIMGQAIAYREFTIPTIEKYAERIQADFHLITDDNRKFPNHKHTYEKFQINDFLDQYDRVLWVDCDIIVKPDVTENIFNIVPKEQLGVLWDGKHFREHRTKRRLLKEIHQIQKGLGDISWKYGYFNAGVMVFSQEHKILFKDGFEYALPLKIWTWNDQSVFNYHRAKYKVKTYALQPKWNAMNNKVNPKWLINNANFAHFSGRIQKKNMNNFIESLKDYRQQVGLSTTTA